MLHVNEIQKSMNGEINKFHQGSPAIFVRFQGCNFRNKPCAYCDTQKALNITKRQTNAWDVSRLYSHIHKYSNEHDVVVLTGGEPLIQDPYELLKLIDILMANERKVVIETNGSINPVQIITTFPKVNIVMDYKLLSSNNITRMSLFNFMRLRETDIIKFPVLTETDLRVAKEVREKLGRKKAVFAVSPVILKKGTTDEILNSVDYVLESAMKEGFTFSIQLHKLLGIY